MSIISTENDKIRLYKIVAHHLQLKTWKTVHTHYIINSRLTRERMDISFYALANAISNEFQCDLKTADFTQLVKSNANMIDIIKLINKEPSGSVYTGGVSLVEEEKQFCIIKVAINEDKSAYFSKISDKHYSLEDNREDAALLPYSHVNRFMGNNNKLITNKFVNTLHQKFIETINGNFSAVSAENSMTIEIIVFKQSESLTTSYITKDIEAIDMMATERDHLEYLKLNMDEDVLKYLRFKGIDV